MNTPNEPNQNSELLAQLTQLLRQAQPGATATGPAMPGGPGPGWQPPAPAFATAAPPQFFTGSAVAPVGLLVAINIPMPDGELAGYVQLPPAALTNPQAAIAQLAAAGWPLRIYGGGNRSGWQQGRRSFYNRGGGWR